MPTAHGRQHTHENYLSQCPTLYDRLQDHRHLVWLPCAATSLLTTRHLLVEANLHYPLQLYICQIVATAILVFISHLWRKNDQKRNSEQEQPTRPIQASLLVVASHALQAVAALCITQAVLHTSNLPLLCMTATIAFFAEGLILCVFSYTSRSGVASALRKLASKHYPGVSLSQSTDANWLVAMGVLITAFCALSGWPDEHRNPLDRENLLLRTLNAISTGAALLMGGSVLFPIETVGNGQTSDYTASQRVSDVFTQLTLTAIIGCFTTLSLRRSYSSWYQLCFYFLAVLCICGHEVYMSSWKQARQPKDPHGSYDMVPCSPRTRSDDIEEAGEADMLANLPDYSHGFRSSFSSIILVMLWTAYISFNFGQRQYPRIEPRLDLRYETNSPLEVVISMYKERTEDVASLISRLHAMPQMSQALVTIYLKDSQADEEKVKQETKAHNVVKLPNVGREAETYLNHIVNRWDKLAERTIFLQADIHNPREFYPFFQRYFRANQTGFLNLGWAGNVCHSDDCGDKQGWQDETLLFPEIQSRIDHSVRDGILLSYKGQFVATAARIRGIDKAIYDDLWKLLVDEQSWAHSEPYLQDREDAMSKPWFGYTMERIWNVLFQCSDMDVAWKCPTLLSGWRPGGSIADCQCFDTELVEP
ncbi:hypothetical protein PSV08DRAFT_400022 [Bipolaris maydis]|uniref:uncharacterized protein n=1 Tax=Cochliobolus heterostrophus TaxID=5016 RepID=UPI0024DD3F84|nr:hypothetical protein J3E73DRAFT_419472 [Bipolaris maydis]KAJ5052908.1 hypothetical protein J3E74DRAFT_478728 [Bipolaris maydis]KAJ6273919.1 hypothetical protein PSV08DRAFT_400022 [Bipolaris maydis]KAJ6285142.1 hypothetical protein J3E71DRAFT_397416 [Bipolaris maydis]